MPQTATLPDHSFHSTHKFLCPTLPGIDRRWRGLIEVGFCSCPNFIAMMIWMASFAVAHWPVAMATTAARWEACDNSSSDMGTAVLENKQDFIRSGTENRDEHQHRHTGLSAGHFQSPYREVGLPANTWCQVSLNFQKDELRPKWWDYRRPNHQLSHQPQLSCLEQSPKFTVLLLTPAYASNNR